MATVSELTAKLKVKTESTIALNSIATRVLLRTGVNILAPRNDSDPAAVAKVWAALVEMGYRITI